MTKEQDCDCGIGGSPGERHDVACPRYASTSSNPMVERLTGSLWMVTKPGGYTHINQLGRVYREKSLALLHKDYDEVVVELRLAHETQSAAPKQRLRTLRKTVEHFARSFQQDGHASSETVKELFEAAAVLESLEKRPDETSDEHEDDNRRLREIHKISTQSRVLPEDVERIAILSQWATDSAEKPFVVTDRMQGVDCPHCEDGTAHLHAPPGSSEEPTPSPVCTCTPSKFEATAWGGTMTSAVIDQNCPLHWRQTLIQNSSPEKASGEPDLSGPDHPRQHATMSVDTAPGSRVQYMDCNGYPGDTDHCRRAGLIKDQAYEVVEIDVYSDHSNVRLKGFDGWRFNSVCFCAAENGDEKHG